jgi:hypothetical protein
VVKCTKYFGNSKTNQRIPKDFLGNCSPIGAA